MNTRTMCGARAVTAVVALIVALGLGACAKPAGTDTPRRASQTDSTGPDARGAAAPGGAYIIKIDRPKTVGSKFRVVSTGRVDRDTAMNGRPVAAQSVRMTYAYEGIVTVKSVHACGNATRVEVKIIRLQMAQGGVTRDLLPAGTVVVAETVGDKEKFTVNGKPVAKDADKVLSYAVSLFDGDTTTTNDVFGPDGPQKPGDSWKINTAKMLKSLKGKFKKPSLWPKLTDVTGKATLMAVRKRGGMDVLDLKVQTRIDNIAPHMGSIKVTEGYFEIGMSGWVPRDPKVLNLSYHVMTMKMHFEGEMAQGANVIKIVVDYDQSSKTTTTPVK